MTGCIDGSLLKSAGQDVNYSIVAARWNEAITERLIAGAKDAFIRHGVDGGCINVVRVPGSFEIPLACKTICSGNSACDGIVALGTLLRGETDHYSHVAAGLSSGITQVMLEFGIPIGFGVITADTMEQAWARAGGKAGNKGWEAACAVLEMSNVVRELRKISSNP